MSDQTKITGFEKYRCIKSAEHASACVKAIAEADGIFDELWFPDDVAIAVASFAARGVHVTLNNAQAVFSAHAEKDAASWVSVPDDAVGGLDWVVQEIIEQTSLHMPHTVAMLRNRPPI